MKNKMRLGILLLGAISLMTVATLSCSKTNDLYREKDIEQPTNDITASVIPSIFDWKTYTEATVKLSVTDDYDGLYYYSIKLYTQDPREEGAELLDAGYVKKGQDWTTHITVPTELTKVYAIETSPLEELTYYSIDIINNEITDATKKTLPATSELVAKETSLQKSTKHKDPGDANFGDIKLSPMLYAFEDNWPYTGDYDMNDVVMEVQMTKQVNKSNRTSSITLKTIVHAVGASKHLSAAIKLDDISPNNIEQVTYEEQEWVGQTIKLNPKGIENSSTETVIGVADNLYAIFGIDKPTFINTINAAIPYVETSIHIKFSQNGVQNSINQSLLNPFIITAIDQNTGKRNEVHIPGKRSTSKVNEATINDALRKKLISKKDHYTTQQNHPFALAINSQFRHPIETKAISSAYKRFLPWAISGGNAHKEWYKSPVVSEVW